MGVEFNISKDLATITATLTELQAVNAIICEEIPSGEFHKEYQSLLFDILNTYRVVTDTLQPLAAIASPGDFRDRFAGVFQQYENNYQPALSEPRVNAEFTFGKYLQFRKRRETRTGYPPVRRTFARLHDFIDRWIDNDIWLAMTVDTMLKLLHRLLGEVAELGRADEEAAFQLYLSCVAGMQPYLQIIASGVDSIERSQRCIDPGAGEDAVRAAR